MLKPIRLRSPVRFRDRWQGEVAAVEVDDQWKVINLTVSKSFLLFRRSVRLPFSAVSDWSRESVSFDCLSDDAFERRVPPLAVPPTSISGETPLGLPGVRLSGLLVERDKRRARYLLLSRRGPANRERKLPVDRVTMEAGTMRPVDPWEGLPVHRDDEELEEMVREALRRDSRITADNLRGISVEAADGNVRLAGNVRGAQVREWAESTAGSVGGVARVVNDLVDDGRLEIEIAQALARAGFYRRAIVYARSHLGEVELSGWAASRSVADDVIRTAAGVPGARRVIDRLDLDVPRWG